MRSSCPTPFLSIIHRSLSPIRYFRTQPEEVLKISRHTIPYGVARDIRSKLIEGNSAIVMGAGFQNARRFLTGINMKFGLKDSEEGMDFDVSVQHKVSADNIRLSYMTHYDTDGYRSYDKICCTTVSIVASYIYQLFGVTTGKLL